MKTSEFTDKKVTELSRSLSDDFSDRDDEDSDFSFQFRPRRPDVSSSSSSSFSQNRSLMDYTDRSGETRVSGSGGALISMIDRKMEVHSKHLLHAVNGLRVRLCQLENRTMKIEDSVDELKVSSLLNHERTELNLKELESVLSEVQAGFRDLKDKHEISEVQIQLTKLQILESCQRSEDRKTKSTKAERNEAKSNLAQHIASQQQYQTPPHQNLPTQQFPNQLLSQNQSSYCSDPSLQKYSAAPIQSQLQPPLPTPPGMYQTYQPVPYTIDPQSRFTSPSQQLPLPVDPQARRFPAQSFGESPYTPHQNPIHSAPQQVYPCPRSSEFHSEHSGFRDDYNNNNNSNFRYSPPSQCSGPRPSSSFNGNNRVSELPKARELPRALPMASEVDRRSSGKARSTAPVDDVIDDVVAMGFRRDLVRATVKKMTESGRSVDLNVVLDKLMRSGEATNQRQ